MATQLFPMLSCTDLAGSLAFYADLLDGVETYPFPENGDPAFIVLRIGETAARARGSGVEIVAEPADMPWGERAAWIADPDGNLVMLTH